jgi:hypothetical protein
MNGKNHFKVQDIKRSVARVMVEMTENASDAEKIGDKELVSKCEAVRKSAFELGEYLSSKTEAPKGV